MSANIDVLLSRLEGVRKSGAGWMARCPTRRDRSASLSIGMGNDGRILLHDFGGESPANILAAIGLTLADLFPERIRDDSPGERRRRRMAARQQQWASALPTLEFETRIVLIAAEQLLRDEPLDWDDFSRLAVALQRIEDARQEFNPVDVRKFLQDLACRRSEGQGVTT